jgi:hypothetical protein
MVNLRVEFVSLEARIVPATIRLPRRKNGVLVTDVRAWRNWYRKERNRAMSALIAMPRPTR